jgi:virulence-associated protein VapD
VSNIVIVESKNDAIFMQAMVDQINCHIQVEQPIYIDDYESLEGLSETKLITTLKDLEADLQKRDIEKIGIIIDIDNYSEPERLEWVNKCIQQVFKSENLSNTKQFIDISGDNGTKAKLACYFTNFGGKGELETLLKAIKARESPHADCLNSWKTCIESQGQQIDQKGFDKFWVSIYLKYDTCSKKEQKQAGGKCSMSGFDYVMKHKKDIWDWNNPALDDLKEFFTLFC